MKGFYIAYKQKMTTYHYILLLTVSPYVTIHFTTALVMTSVCDKSCVYLRTEAAFPSNRHKHVNIMVC